MPGYIAKSGLYRFEEVGMVSVTVRRDARMMRLRWKGPSLVLSVPVGLPYDEALGFLRRNAEFICKHRPEPLYAIGQQISGPDFSIQIKSSSQISGLVQGLLIGENQGCINIAADLDILDPATVKCIDRVLRRIAYRLAPALLLPLAKAEAQRLGATPSQWEISRGLRTLGRCFSTGRIALSSTLIFYPMRLRRYVICHELAHLTHMDHSAAFHALCSRYCGERSTALHAELGKIRLPLIK